MPVKAVVCHKRFSGNDGVCCSLLKCKDIFVVCFVCLCVCICVCFWFFACFFVCLFALCFAFLSLVLFACLVGWFLLG